MEFVATSSSGTEATTPAALGVRLSAISGRSVTVDYAATGGTATGGGVDYTLASGTLTFNPGVTSQVVNVSIVDDIFHEDDETVVVTLSAPVNTLLGTQNAYTYTITDADTLCVASTESDLWLSTTPAPELRRGRTRHTFLPMTLTGRRRSTSAGTT